MIEAFGIVSKIQIYSVTI